MSNVLRVAFSLSSIIDIKKSKKVFQEKGYKDFKLLMKEHEEKGSIFKPGPSLGLFIGLKKLDEKIPNEILDIRFALATNLTGDPSVNYVIMQSLRHYLKENELSEEEGFGFDNLALTGGEQTIPFLRDTFKSDVMITTEKESAKRFFRNGINSVAIPNISDEKNQYAYSLRNNKMAICFDFDGVVGDSKSESIGQEAKASGMTEEESIEEFKRHELLNIDVPMEMGPMGSLIKALGRVTEYEENLGVSSKEHSFSSIIVTARNAITYGRVLLTLKTENVKISQLYMMSGENKNTVLKSVKEQNVDKNILFLDDSQTNYERAVKINNILSGFVANDVNSKKDF